MYVSRKIQLLPAVGALAVMLAGCTGTITVTFNSTETAAETEAVSGEGSSEIREDDQDLSPATEDPSDPEETGDAGGPETAEEPALYPEDILSCWELSSYFPSASGATDTYYSMDSFLEGEDGTAVCTLSSMAGDTQTVRMDPDLADAIATCPVPLYIFPVMDVDPGMDTGDAGDPSFMASYLLFDGQGGALGELDAEEISDYASEFVDAVLITTEASPVLETDTSLSTLQEDTLYVSDGYRLINDTGLVAYIQGTSFDAEQETEEFLQEYLPASTWQTGTAVLEDGYLTVPKGMLFWYTSRTAEEAVSRIPDTDMLRLSVLQESGQYMLSGEGFLYNDTEEPVTVHSQEEATGPVRIQPGELIRIPGAWLGTVWTEGADTGEDAQAA